MGRRSSRLSAENAASRFDVSMLIRLMNGSALACSAGSIKWGLTGDGNCQKVH